MSVLSLLLRFEFCCNLRVDIEVVVKEDMNNENFEDVMVDGLSSPDLEIITYSALSKIASVQERTTSPTHRSIRGGWTEKEDDMLKKSVRLFNRKNWKKITQSFPRRSDVQCLHRWQKVLNPDLVKQPWAKEEDKCIIELVETWFEKVVCNSAVCARTHRQTMLRKEYKGAIAQAGGIKAPGDLIFKWPSGSDGVLEPDAGALANLAADDKCSTKVAIVGGVHAMVTLARSCKFEGVQEQTARALANLDAHRESNGNNTAIGQEAGALKALVQLTCSHHEGVRQEATGALWNLSFDDRNREAIVTIGGVEALVSLVQNCSNASQ